jgi:uncharacterized BrkB/YihY/UPF0761 family membrane protein
MTWKVFFTRLIKELDHAYDVVETRPFWKRRILWGFSQYVQHFGSYEATYGALGSVIVLLLWMWVSSMALMLGAEINKILMPVDEAAQVATHVTNMPETAKQQEGSPEIQPETHAGEHAETELAHAERPEAAGCAMKTPGP